ncbi:related to oxidoreductase [Rhynchosporium agropyri]|uniref:Related to oxidoreductase n=1 Tax=Rhynchosporium agropyri TaxID=914238 RepID=A0A1E1KJX4_9HELO|nr:related to oxidoreductase [Rhynchosporium agropyri]
MSAEIPTTMRALALARHCNPSAYNCATLPVPKITKPDELLIKVYAASVNPVDVKLAGDMGKLMQKASFPYQMGNDLAGEVVGLGTAVSKFKLGDQVYSRVPEAYRGTIAPYALATVSTTALKPKSLSYTEAASIPLAAQTAYQALLLGDKKVPGGLKGKTVLIPAGLSGTGSFAVQLSKNVFGAGKVITTLSTGKIPLIKKLMGDSAPDQIVDYTKENIVKVVGMESVDFMFDTVKQTMSALPLLKKGGMIVSISTVPNGTGFKEVYKDMPTWMEYILNVMDWFYRSWASWKSVQYEYIKVHGNTEHLEALAKAVDEGKMKPIVGSTAKLSDLEAVKNGCQQIMEGKGGVGKFVIEID